MSEIILKQMHALHHHYHIFRGVADNFPTQPKYDILRRPDRNTGNSVPYSFRKLCAFSFESRRIVNNEELRDVCLQFIFRED